MAKRKMKVFKYRVHCKVCGTEEYTNSADIDVCPACGSTELISYSANFVPTPRTLTNSQVLAYFMFTLTAGAAFGGIVYAIIRMCM